MVKKFPAAAAFVDTRCAQRRFILLRRQRQPCHLSMLRHPMRKTVVFGCLAVYKYCEKRGSPFPNATHF